MKARIILFVFACFLLVTCKKAKDNPSPDNDPGKNQELKKGSFTIQLQSRAGSQAFETGKDYINAKGETFRINILKYFVGKVTLRKTDGTSLVLEDQYYLVNSPEQELITVKNVPHGTYSGISFEIGVDSAHHAVTPKSGTTLDPAMNPDMVWTTWGLQYIFMFIEGSSPSSPLSGKVMQYHIAGFRKTDYAVQTIQTDFGSEFIDIRPNAVPNVHYYADILEVFKNPSLISIAELPSVHMAGNEAVIISNNYKDMFKFQHLEN